jgi:cytidylate kinase
VTTRVGDIVERQVREWDLRTREAAPHRPCVAFSRLPGAGADELGHKLAERLGYTYYGIEILDLIAKDSGVSRKLLEGVDERVRSAIERYVIDAFRTHGFTENDYLREVVHTVTTLGERGGAVILGRGSPFILGPHQALRVLVTAPLRDRVVRTAKERSRSESEAERLLADEERFRGEFIQQSFGVDPNDASRYDLVVNTVTLSIEGALEVIVTALRRRFPKSAHG